MTRREVFELIYRALGETLSNTNFRLERSEERYVRNIVGGWQVIGVPFYDYNPRFEFSLVMAIRLDEVQKITCMFSGSPPEYRAETVSAIIQIEYFAEVPNTFIVWSEEDIDKAAAVLSPIVREKIVPFMDTHRDVRALDEALHRGSKQLDSSFHPYRGMSGITIAKLAGNPEFDFLVEKYLAEMACKPEEDREKFVRLVEYLKSEEFAAKLTGKGDITDCGKIGT
jgi:hypothetical protein